MKIDSKSGLSSEAPSNFLPHTFVFDGVECASMEGLLQSFKFDNEQVQIEVCKLVDTAAKFRGKKRNKAWKREQTLWWKGVAYERKSKEYQELLDRAFDALATNAGFRKALIATQSATLTHSIGCAQMSNTVLTEAEFCSRLTKIRTRLQAELK
ncbi:hypothetical protein HQ571_01630 [Candidatus Kuenenbacteria bacterium]|nr:hypothetical protein [Candidatus Kuenenbacteria bacterium]